jgi:pimeloyl-ACP methyl ester carboxylesterase
MTLPYARRWALALALLTTPFVTWTALAWRSGFLGTPAEARIRAREADEIDAFSRQKRYATVDDVQVAYVEQGQGPPVILLHGCPFHAYEWKEVIPRLAEHHRVIVPDLLGLGDTLVSLAHDYRLPEDVKLVVGLMDSLGIDEAAFVGHDHGGATLQLLMGSHPERISRAVLTNAEAYDAWPSGPERQYLEWVVNPLTSPLFHLALESTTVRRHVLGIAVHREEVLTDEVLAAYITPHTSSAVRWQRLVRFFRWQLDPEHPRQTTLAAVEGMRRFDKPTLILWGEQDDNFGVDIAHRLADDIAGTVGIVWLHESAHLPMQEEPEAYADALQSFLAGDLDHGVGSLTRRTP